MFLGIVFICSMENRVCFCAASLVEKEKCNVMFLFLHSVVFFGRLSQLRVVWYRVNKAQGFGSYTPRPFLSSHLVCMQVCTVGGHVVLVDCYLKKAYEVNMCETTRTKIYKTKQYKQIQIYYISTIHSMKDFKTLLVL